MSECLFHCIQMPLSKGNIIKGLTHPSVNNNKLGVSMRWCHIAGGETRVTSVRGGSCDGPARTPDILALIASSATPAERHHPTASEGAGAQLRARRQLRGLPRGPELAQPPPRDGFHCLHRHTGGREAAEETNQIGFPSFKSSNLTHHRKEMLC